MKKMILALICLISMTSLMACGTPHNPDQTFGHLMKGTFYYEPESFDWNTFTGALVLVPRYAEDGIPKSTDVPSPFVQAGREELNEELSKLNISFDSYDPEQSYRLAEQLAAIPKIDDAKVFVFDQQVLVGAETWRDHDRLRQQIYQTAQRAVPGKEIHISLDPDIFNQLGNMDHYLNGGYYKFGEND